MFVNEMRIPEGALTIEITGLIPGLQAAIMGMKPNEIREVHIHPSYAYGNRLQVPPNLGLIVTIELTKIEEQNENESKPVLELLNFEVSSQSEAELDAVYAAAKHRLACQMGIKTWNHLKQGNLCSFEDVKKHLAAFKNNPQKIEILDNEVDAMHSQIH